MVECRRGSLERPRIQPPTSVRAWPTRARPKLLLERTEVGPGHRVVPAVSLSVHALHDAGLVEGCAGLGAGVMRATVGVVHQPRAGLAYGQGALEGFKARLRAHAVHLAAVRIDQHGEVRPARANGQVCDVGHPRHLRCRHREVARARSARLGAGAPSRSSFCGSDAEACRASPDHAGAARRAGG